MYLAEVKEEYKNALKAGHKEYTERVLQNRNPYPEVLDEKLKTVPVGSTLDVGMVDIPVDRIVGVKSAGRIFAFTAGFLPLLDPDSEFARKWCDLCSFHMSDTGIREPIECFEYMGNFYVQEGNKRVSVLKYYGASRIPGQVKRILPAASDAPEVIAYQEFLEFYQSSKLYDVQFRCPGDYAKLLSFLGKEPGEEWNERERTTFRSYFFYFREAIKAAKLQSLDLLPEEALLLWLRVHTFQELGQLSADELTKAVVALREELIAIAQEEPVQVQTEPAPDVKPGLLEKLITLTPDKLQVAFVHQRDVQSSPWTAGHEEGAQYVARTFGDKVTVRSYFHADSPEEAEDILEQAVEEGSQMVFTTTPQLARSALKVAVKYPKIKFLNCSVAAPYPSVRTYYSRLYEGKFITGAIAGAMSNNDKIGYIGNYPIYGVPACINAFALGAQLTNPRARIELRWSCQPGKHVREFLDKGIQVVSNRDMPTTNQMQLEYGNHGTYFIGEDGELVHLGAPVWIWGKLYEHMIRSVFNGTWSNSKAGSQAVNYWWGMDSGAIDVSLTDRLPDGLKVLAETLRRGLQDKTIDPFRRKIVAQDGTVKNPGDYSFTPEELLKMDWLCENVDGTIPEYDEVLPFSQAMVRELGIHRENIPLEKEGTL